MQSMDNEMCVTIRKFCESDIPNKVDWINNPLNNRYLHYELPLEIEKTKTWFLKNKHRTDRYDGVIEVNGVPVGLIGLLSIDYNNGKAEYYITIGERDYLGKGIATEASKQLLEYAFKELGLNRVYLFVEKENTAAIRLYERVGFKREGLLNNDLFCKGHYIDRYVYGIAKTDFLNIENTPIYKIDVLCNNNLYIKRDDLLPFSFGGNKARKAHLFFEVIDQGDYNCVVTYGSSSSNHCRVISNMAAARGMKCYIVSPEETSKETYNSKMMRTFGAKIITCSVNDVKDTIDRTLQVLKENGKKPYFIAGGGHGNIGTRAYVTCYEEIRQYEQENNIHFDYIFHASGTGTTQAGLVCGQLINDDNRRIIGISIARKNPRGRDVVVDSIKSYLNENKVFISDEAIEQAVVFLDDFINKGYGDSSDVITETIQNVMTRYGIPLDETYTGKAFTGMVEYLNREQIKNKNILFIHTGGTPLFFDNWCYVTEKI